MTNMTKWISKAVGGGEAVRTVRVPPSETPRAPGEPGMAALATENATLRAANNTLQQENARLRAQAERTTERCVAALQSNHDRLMDLEAENARLRSDAMRAFLRINALAAQLHEREGVQQHCAQVEQENERLQQQLSQSQDHVQALRAQAREDQCARTVLQEAARDSMVRRLKSELRTKERQWAQAKADLETQVEQASQVSDKRVAVQPELTLVRQDLESGMERLGEENQALRAAIATQATQEERHAAELGRRMEQLSLQVEDTRAVLAAVSDRLEAEQTRSASLQAQLEQARGRVGHLTALMKRLWAVRCQLTEENESLLDRLEDKRVLVQHVRRKEEVCYEVLNAKLCRVRDMLRRWRAHAAKAEATIKALRDKRITVEALPAKAEPNPDSDPTLFSADLSKKAKEAARKRGKNLAAELHVSMGPPEEASSLPRSESGAASRSAPIDGQTAPSKALDGRSKRSRQVHWPDESKKNANATAPTQAQTATNSPTTSQEHSDGALVEAATRPSLPHPAMSSAGWLWATFKAWVNWSRCGSSIAS